jgi:hypothetical protein
MFSNSLDSAIMPSTASQVMFSFRRSLNTRMVWYLQQMHTTNVHCVQVPSSEFKPPQGRKVPGPKYLAGGINYTRSLWGRCNADCDGFVRDVVLALYS